MRVGKIIKQERTKRGWSQADLGRMLHMGKASISRWESGEREPGREALSRIAAVMELSVEAFFDPRQQSLFRPESLAVSKSRSLAVDPVLETGGVDLVLTGHSHIYERSMLIDGAYATPTVAENVVFEDREGNPETDGPYRKSAGIMPNNGDIQVVAGHGGTTIGRKGTLPLMRKTIVEHGSVLVDINGDTLTGTMINKFGEVRDTFALRKRGTVVHERIAVPWQPQAYKPVKSPGDEFPGEPPEDFFVVIPKFAEWEYLAGSHPEGQKWTELKYVPEGWKHGEAPFGYEYKEARTVLEDMKGNFTVLYLRHIFEIEQADQVAEIGLMINYDDAFIAYLNGKEVVRKGVGKGAGKDAQQIKSHDATRYNYFPLKDFEKHVKTGRNVLAIEAHNSSVTSHDFLIDPYLVLED